MSAANDVKEPAVQGQHIWPPRYWSCIVRNEIPGAGIVAGVVTAVLTFGLAEVIARLVAWNDPSETIRDQTASRMRLSIAEVTRLHDLNLLSLARLKSASSRVQAAGRRAMDEDLGYLTTLANVDLVRYDSSSRQPHQNGSAWPTSSAERRSLRSSKS